MVSVLGDCRDEPDLREYEAVIGDWDNSREDGTEQRFDIANITIYPDYKSVLTKSCAR
jgi:hypothetical protein